MIIHRQLTHILRNEPELIKAVEDKVVEMCNRAKKDSRTLGRKSDDMYLGLYLIRNPIQVEGYVYHLGKTSIKVSVPALSLFNIINLKQYRD